MSCLSYALKGIPRECGSVAGIKKLYIGLASDFEATPSSAAASAQTIESLSALSESAALYEYYVEDESTSLTSTLTVNNQNGVKYYTNAIAATFVKMTPEKHLEMRALANEKLIVIAVDNNDYSWYLGIGAAATCSEQTAQSGQAYDDLSGYQITINQRSSALPYSIASDLYSEFID